MEKCKNTYWQRVPIETLYKRRYKGEMNLDFEVKLVERTAVENEQ